MVVGSIIPFSIDVSSRLIISGLVSVGTAIAPSIGVSECSKAHSHLHLSSTAPTTTPPLAKHHPTPASIELIQHSSPHSSFTGNFRYVQLPSAPLVHSSPFLLLTSATIVTCFPLHPSSTVHLCTPHPQLSLPQPKLGSACFSTPHLQLMSAPSYPTLTSAPFIHILPVSVMHSSPAPLIHSSHEPLVHSSSVYSTDHRHSPLQLTCTHEPSVHSSSASPKLLSTAYLHP